MHREDGSPRDVVIHTTTPQWCAVETDGITIVLFLTSVRTAWLKEVTAFIRRAAARHNPRRTPVLSIFRLDKRYPLEVGFDSNLLDLLRGLRRLAPSISASAVVLEFDGLLALTMKSAVTTLTRLARVRFPTEIHTSVVDAVRWIEPHVADGEWSSISRYIDVVARMKSELGCAVPQSRQERTTRPNRRARP